VSFILPAFSASGHIYRQETHAARPGNALVTVDDLLASLGPNRSPEDTQYSIPLELGPGFLAQGPGRSASFLIPLGSVAQESGRVVAGLSLAFKDRVLFETTDCRWEEPAAVLECRDEGRIRAFCGLCLDLASRLATSQPRATARDVLEALREWETLR
jgi:hypothetical protein